MDTSSNPMAQTDAVEQRFAPAPSAVASSATPEQGSASAPDAASANVFNVEGTDIIEGGSIAGLDVLEALKDVIDPDLGINIVDLGLVYGVKVARDDSIVIDMTLTSAACPLTDIIERQAQMVLASLSDDVLINWVWMPAWGPDRITSDGREQLRAIGFNV